MISRRIIQASSLLLSFFFALPALALSDIPPTAGADREALCRRGGHLKVRDSSTARPHLTRGLPLLAIEFGRAIETLDRVQTTRGLIEESALPLAMAQEWHGRTPPLRWQIQLVWALGAPTPSEESSRPEEAQRKARALGALCRRWAMHERAGAPRLDLEARIAHHIEDALLTTLFELHAGFPSKEDRRSTWRL